MNRIFRPISRFFRGLTRRMRIALILLLVLALSLAAFGIYKLIKGDDGQNSPYRQLDLLFEKIPRESLAKIEMYPKDGTPYSIERYTYQSNGADMVGFKLYIDGKSQELLTLDPTALTSLIVGAGTSYIYDTVLSAPEASDPDYAAKMAVYEQKLIEYKLTDDAPYYEITDVSGRTHRVYFGSKSPTGSSYYMRLDGRDTVYIASGSAMGDFLYASGPESLVYASLFWKESLIAGTTIPAQSYAWANLFRIKDYTRYKKEDPQNADLTVSDGDGVGVTLKNEDGTFTATDFDLASDTIPAVFAETLLGKKLGNCDFSFDAVFEVEGEDGKTETVERHYHVVSIDYIQRAETMIETSYVNVSERDISHLYSIYKFTMPELKKYLPDTNDVMAALEKTYGLTGSVVKIGIDFDSISKYGLYRHTVEMNYPVFDADDMYVLDKDGNPTEDLKPLEYMPGFLYVSDETERGTRYVATLTYDLILEVEASSLSYLDYDLVEWIEPDMVGGAISDITDIHVNWNYGDGAWMNGGYQLSVSHGLAENYDGSPYEIIEAVTALKTRGEGAERITVDPAIYTQFFYRLYYIRYKGSHGLTDEQVSALLADKSKTALQMNVYYEDDSISIYRFIPISSDRVMVAVSGDGVESGAHFVIYGTAFKDLARAYIHMMEGTSFDHANRYE